MANGPISNLNVLNLCGLASHAVRVRTSLNAHQLHFNRLDCSGALLNDDFSREGVLYAADDGVDATADLNEAFSE